ncbi:MAG: tRNA uridine-5-carboxymethylaminomethyl(34) synthesis GTPase MnmE [Nevskiaceae bacterium]|nr:MAG: tRNA uridine-5-carboxymethylaminomethyl(34) synthesis GTPase MnmE [Nevskiaceae bacterium]TBR72493.1 MAG: tRNA uridine-5-carboxymethylaminomethyl(34) synthesis GTPase MnmE [Nevskiaceae bacterium]
MTDRNAGEDTIAAVATAPGRGAVSIVRVSGRDAVAVAGRVVGTLPPPRQAALKPFHDAGGNVIDRGIVLHFPAPRSYTGEDVVELQGHGGRVVTDMVLGALLVAGARGAEPGEFSRRAYLNGRIDLAQAEAVADLIDAATETAARAAQRSLSGAFSERVSALSEAIQEVRARVEGALDFSDEDAAWFGPQLEAAFERVTQELEELLRNAGQGRRFTEGCVIALAGQPNVGKSTLLNRLSGTDVAIVTEIAGTTRDVLRESINLGGMAVTLVDTAGLRDSSDDPVELEGVRRARKAFKASEMILYLVDARTGLDAEDRREWQALPSSVPRLLVYNKIDILATSDEKALPEGASGISAATGAGMDALVAQIHQRLGIEGETPAYSARSRHLRALQQTQLHVEQARTLLGAAHELELVAEELRLARCAVDEICGRSTTEDLLGHIFAGFCIGK